MFHTCICGATVDSSDVHELSCRKSAGRHLRHNALNDLIQRSLATAEVPARLEPSSLSRSDGKRPDGKTMMPWKQGRCFDVWDVTCPDTMAPSHLNQAVSGPGVVTTAAKVRRINGFLQSIGSTHQDSAKGESRFRVFHAETNVSLQRETPSVFSAHCLLHRTR